MSQSMPKPRYVGDASHVRAVLARLPARPGDYDAARRSDCYRRVCGLLSQAYDAPPEHREAILESAKLQLTPLFAAYETARQLIETAELELLTEPD